MTALRKELLVVNNSHARECKVRLDLESELKQTVAELNEVKTASEKQLLTLGMNQSDIDSKTKVRHSGDCLCVPQL